MEINLYTILWQVLNFFILLFILRVFLFKPVFHVLDSRKQQIDAQIEEADKIKKDAETLRAQYEAQLAEEKKEGERIIAAAIRTGEETKNNIIAEAQKEAEALRKKAEEQMAAEKQRAMRSLIKDVADYSAELVARLSRKTVDKATHAKLLEEVIAEAGETEWKV